MMPGIKLQTFGNEAISLPLCCNCLQLILNANFYQKNVSKLFCYFEKNFNFNLIIFALHLYNSGNQDSKDRLN
jgi:hypothetical protein